MNWLYPLYEKIHYYLTQRSMGTDIKIMGVTDLGNGKYLVKKNEAQQKALEKRYPGKTWGEAIIEELSKPPNNIHKI